MTVNLDGRSFKLWDYRVSHKQLLLRSPRSAVAPNNIDIAFVGVDYLDLPTELRHVALEPAQEADLAKAEEALGVVDQQSEVFVIRTPSRRYIIVAVAMKIFENDLDIFESSLENFGA